MRLPNEHLSGAAAFSVIALAMPALAMAQTLEPEQGEERDAAVETRASTTDGAATSGAPAASSGYDRGFFIKGEDGRFGLKLQGRVQTRYTFESELDPATDERQEKSNFAIQRARLSLSGHAFDKGLTYKFQSDFGRGDVSLRDFHVDYKLGSAAQIRVGQWKRPFSRQQITSSGSLSLVDRAITDRAFGSGRDIGLAVHNDYEKSPELEWVVGVFNGTGDRQVPDMFAPAIVARVGYNQGGIRGYSEGDLEGGSLRYGVGASVLTELDMDDDDQSSVRAQLDYIVKVNGLSSTGGIYIATAQDGEGFADQTYNAMGFHVQVGYMLADQHQAVGRYAMVSPDGGDSQQELSLGYSLYRFKHNFKWQSDLSFLADGGASLGDALRVRSQLQLSF